MRGVAFVLLQGCQGQEGGSAEWDPNGEELDGWRWDCEEIVDYGPEDFD